MSNVIEFKAHGKAYPLAIIDDDGHRWVAAQQVGEALGNKNIRMTIRSLVESAEITRNKHYRKLRLHSSTRGNPEKMVLSYRGVIRVMMRSQGCRAREFRDWAEDVLAEVMATGRYGDDIGNEADVQKAVLAGFCCGMDTFRRFATWGIDVDAVSKMAWYRRRGLTQKETAKLLDITVDHVQEIEKLLHNAMIHFQPINHMVRSKQMRDEFRENVMLVAERENIVQTSLSSYIKERLVLDPASEVPTVAVFDDYKLWAKNCGYQAISRNRFYRLLLDAMPMMQRRAFGPERRYHFVGVHLRDSIVIAES